MERQSPDIFRELRTCRAARFDGKLVLLPIHAARVLAELGYEKAFKRQVAQVAGLSLADLNHHMSCKEGLHFFIQYQISGVLIERLDGALDRPASPVVYLKEMFAIAGPNILALYLSWMLIWFVMWFDFTWTRLGLISSKYVEFFLNGCQSVLASDLDADGTMGVNG